MPHPLYDQEAPTERRAEIRHLSDAHDTACEDLHHAKQHNDEAEIARLKDQPEKSLKQLVLAMHSFNRKYPHAFRHWKMWDEQVHEAIEDTLAVFREQLQKEQYGGGDFDVKPLLAPWDAYNAAWFRNSPEYDVLPSLRGRYGLGTESSRTPVSSCRTLSSDGTGTLRSSSSGRESCGTAVGTDNTTDEDDPEEFAEQAEIDAARKMLEECMAALEGMQGKHEQEEQIEEFRELVHQELLDSLEETIADVQDELMEMQEEVCLIIEREGSTTEKSVETTDGGSVIEESESSTED